MDANDNRWGKRLEPLLVPALVALVGLACFGLGRLSVSPTAVPRLVINSPMAPTGQGGQVAAVAAARQGAYVAAQSGTKYYLPTCSGTNRIKEENKVWFNSTAEAEAAGYGPAANCPGL